MFYNHAGLCFEILPKGTRIKFREEKCRYTVRASNRFYAVCTKPFNVRNTVLYTVIDFDDKPERLRQVIGRGR